MTGPLRKVYGDNSLKKVSNLQMDNISKKDEMKLKMINGLANHQHQFVRKTINAVRDLIKND